MELAKFTTKIGIQSYEDFMFESSGEIDNVTSPIEDDDQREKLINRLTTEYQRCYQQVFEKEIQEVATQMDIDVTVDWDEETISFSAKKDGQDTCTQIFECLNGVGLEYEPIKGAFQDYIDSNAVPAICFYPDVYGSQSLKRSFSDALESKLKYHNLA